eukprot:72825_1
MTSAVSCTNYKEEFSGIRVKNRVTSRADIRTCMQGRVYYGLSCLASVSREALSSKTGANDWATCGIVSTKLQEKKGNNGRIFGTARLSDLSLGGTETLLFFFGDTISDFRNLSRGHLVFLLNPKPLPRSKSTDDLALSMDASWQLVKVGRAMDFALCTAQGWRGDEEGCTTAVDKRMTRFCSRHSKQLFGNQKGHQISKLVHGRSGNQIAYPTRALKPSQVKPEPVVCTQYPMGENHLSKSTLQSSTSLTEKDGKGLLSHRLRQSRVAAGHSKPLAKMYSSITNQPHKYKLVRKRVKTVTGCSAEAVKQQHKAHLTCKMAKESHPARRVLSGNIGFMNVTARCSENETPSALEPKTNVLTTSGKRLGESMIGVMRGKKETTILEQPTSSSSTTPRNGSELRSSHPLSSAVEDVLDTKLGWTRPIPGGKEKQTPSVVEDVLGTKLGWTRPIPGGKEKQTPSVVEDVLGTKLGWTRPTPGGKEKQISSSIIEPKDNIHFANHHPKPYYPPVSITEVPSIGLTGCVLRSTSCSTSTSPSIPDKINRDGQVLVPHEASIFMIDGRKLKAPKSKATPSVQSKYGGRTTSMGRVDKFRLEQSKLEKLESRKRVKASLEARTGVVKPLVKSSYTSALKQVKGGQPPHAKLSCLTDEDMAKMVAGEKECALEAARGQEKEHQMIMNSLERREYARGQVEANKEEMVTAFRCNECNAYRTGPALDSCREEGHCLVHQRVMKRFFECSKCQSRTSVLATLLPFENCARCGADATTWVSCGAATHSERDWGQARMVTSISESSSASDMRSPLLE